MGLRANRISRSELLGAIAILSFWGFAALAAGSASDQPAGAQEPRVEPGSMHVPQDSSPEGSPPGLDALLHLPNGYVGRPVRFVAGASEAEWKRRFLTGNETVAASRDALEATKLELDGVAEQGGGTQWSVAPPTGAGGGGAPSASPLSFKLRQELKQHRADLELAEKALRKLQIEADLAGVPRSWRGEAAVAGVVPPEVGQLID